MGISQSAAGRHASVLRDAGLTTSRQIGPTVLHTLTPLGAALLRQTRGAGPENRDASRALPRRERCRAVRP
ncbi:helix-turn-helix domain-containing protein [Streptomyces sp. L7]